MENFSGWTWTSVPIATTRRRWRFFCRPQQRGVPHHSESRTAQAIASGFRRSTRFSAHSAFRSCSEHAQTPNFKGRERLHPRNRRTLRAQFSGKSAAAGRALRNEFSAVPDGSVTLIGIDPMINLARALQDCETCELFVRKVDRLVMMAGCFGRDEPKVEWNIEMDVPTARIVLISFRGESVSAHLKRQRTY